MIACQGDRGFTVVDLFCGAGGLTLGLHEAGFRTLAAFDNWGPAAQTFRLNLGPQVCQAEIGEDFDLPNASLIVGGPPCQGFSSAGARRKDDQRNSLVSIFARIVARHKPAVFLFENVEGFLTHNEGHHVLELLDPLIDAGYRIHLRKINAANYGVPQLRKRVIAIGALRQDVAFPAPTHCAHGAPGAHLAGQGLPLTPSLAECLAGLPKATTIAPCEALDHTYAPLEGLDLERANRLRPGQIMRDLPEELWHESYRRRAYRRVKDGLPTERRGGAPAGLRRLDPDEPSKAITSSAIRDFIHPYEDRPLTIRECARIQTFPDTFRFVGSKVERATLIGNAVPPRLGAVFGHSLSKALQEGCADKEGGRLLTFVPTLSDGMSPALNRVIREVERRFGLSLEPREQLTLWH
ncbi:MAG: DNA cytosine methyltransferase [Chloroflexi bacterium]|nr:DNA cytosine methyltransferase [Chloroflexota bacterium]